MMYWPNNVNEKGVALNTSPEKKISGVNVKIICPKATYITNFLQTLQKSNKPIALSSMAKRMIETFEGIKPKVRL